MDNCRVALDVPFDTTSFRAGRYFDCEAGVNGIAIYYNITSLLASCNCAAGFRPDPDIAGPGVMTSFIATAFITLFVASVNVFCSMSASCKKYLCNTAFDNTKDGIWSLLKANFLSTSQKWCATEHRHPLAKLELVISKFYQPLPTFLRYVSYPIILIFSNEHPKTKKFAELALDLLCDIQVVTGTAVVIAGLIQLEEMSYYHQQFVLSYDLLILNSFWAARAGALNSKKTEKVKGWHYWTRTVAIFCCLALSTTYQLLVGPEQEENWSPVKEGRCYIDHDKSSSELRALWLAGYLAYTGYLGYKIFTDLILKTLVKLKPISTADRNWRYSFLGVYGHETSKERRDAFLGLFRRKAIKKYRNRLMDIMEGKSRIVQFFIYVMFAFVLAALYILNVFLEITAWGDIESLLVVAIYFAFAGWNTWGLIDMKLSNADLVEKEERTWGFGQCLAVGLLGLVVLNCGDAWKEARKETDSNDS